MTREDDQLLRLRARCIGEYGQVTAWPDGRALLDQPVKLIQAFNVIADAYEMLRQTK